jgi:hypothetical protein
MLHRPKCPHKRLTNHSWRGEVQLLAGEEVEVFRPNQPQKLCLLAKGRKKQKTQEEEFFS